MQMDVCMMAWDLGFEIGAGNFEIRCISCQSSVFKYSIVVPVII